MSVQDPHVDRERDSRSESQAGRQNHGWRFRSGLSPGISCVRKPVLFELVPAGEDVKTDRERERKG